MGEAARLAGPRPWPARCCPRVDRSAGYRAPMLPASPTLLSVPAALPSSPELRMWLVPAVLVASVAALVWLLGPLVRLLDTRRSPLGAPVRALRNLLLPSAAAWAWVRFELELPAQHLGLRVVTTLFWVCLLHTVLSLLNALLFGRPTTDAAGGPERLPKLFRDLLRAFLVVVGGALVASEVWNTDLTGWITALGVGSLVLGLALQETLGNLFSGVALLFERPVSPGDWLRIGELQGEIVEINWRAIRIRTRSRDLVVVPNSVLGREVFHNYSLPTAVHREELFIGFSYDDPPNKVKRVLTQCAEATRGILDQPVPAVRTYEFGDFAITYQLQLAVRDFDRLPDILDEFRTRVWYAARRNSLTIPFPIRTVYQTQMPPPRTVDRGDARFHDLRRVALLAPLNDEEVRALAARAGESSFGAGERVVRQGEPGQALYVVRSGEAAVEVRNDAGQAREVARLGVGEFFGEMGLLTGDPRSADVRAIQDLEVLTLYPEDLKPLLAARPELAEALAQQVQQRGRGLFEAREANRGLPAAAAEARSTGLLERIRYFLGL